MAAADNRKLEKTSTPGIYRRHGGNCARAGRCECAYVVVYGGKARTFPTMAEAREGKRLAERHAKLSRAHSAGLHRDEPRDQCPDCESEQVQREQAEPTLHEYALAVIDRYQGTGRRGYREETRDEDRRLLDRYALSYFPADMRLSDIGPKQIADFIGWLIKQPSSRGGTISDSSIRNALKPLRFVLATARREGLIAHNPASEAVLPHRPGVEDHEDAPRPFPSVDGVETIELVVSLVHPDHRAMFELLSATGIRRSELLALEVRHLALDGERPHVKVRQRVRRQRGKGLVIGPLKSRYARRDLPISLVLADRLRPLVAGRPDRELAFRSRVGTALDPDNLAERVLAPACAEAGVEWAGFHTFRHTVASRLFADGRNVVAVQRWLGHHSPSFTLDTYVHLLDEELGEPVNPRPGKPRVDGLWVKKRSSEGPQTATNEHDAETEQMSSLQT